MRSKKLVSIVLACSLVVSGCASQPGADSGSTWANVIGGTVGAATGLVAAELLANAEGKRLRLSKPEIEKRKRGYMIAFALLGAAGGAALGGSIYGKLKEQGKKERENALLAAAQQARPQRYGEPSDPALKGTITPGVKYADKGANRECMDVEDALADASNREAIFVKMCRSMPNGGWQPVTA